MSNLEILIPISLFYIVYLIIKTVSDNRLRQKLIDKGLVDEKVKYLFVKNSELQPMPSLKWGIVLIAIGVALFVNAMFPLLMEGPASFGFVSVLAGLAFIVYYFIAKNQKDTE
jgi:hypothetical protein